MRRIDVLGVGLAVFIIGGLLYGALQLVGLDPQTAGIWSQAVLVSGLIGWLLTYLFRVVRHDMTYDQQQKAYEEAVLQKRYEELSPQQLAELQAEVERDRSEKSDKS